MKKNFHLINIFFQVIKTVLIEAIKLVNFSALFISNLPIVLRVRVILSARDIRMHVVIVKSIKSIRPPIVHSFELTLVISRFEKLKFSSPIPLDHSELLYPREFGACPPTKRSFDFDYTPNCSCAFFAAHCKSIFCNEWWIKWTEHIHRFPWISGFVEIIKRKQQQFW